MNRIKRAGLGCWLAAAAVSVCVQQQGMAYQDVYLDFDSIKDAFAAGGPGPGIPPADEIFDYVPIAKSFIHSYLTERFAPYGVSLHVGLPPIPFTASTITFNKGSGGASEGVDFRNQVSHDEADINAVAALKFVGAPEPFSFGDIVMASANLAGHELGHLLGAAHTDSFDMIGSGIGIAPTEFFPTYPGPGPLTGGAPFTGKTMQYLTTGLGLSYGNLTTPRYLGEREVVKIVAGRSGGDEFLIDETSDFHNAVEDAQMLTLEGFAVPYPMRPMPVVMPGDPPPPPPLGILKGRMAAVTGTLEDSILFPSAAEGDYYKFFATEGEFITLELITAVDTMVFVLDEVGALVLYYGGEPVLNDDGYDSVASQIFDIPITATGTYIIEITTSPFAPTDRGEYELFVYQGRGFLIPEPASVGGVVLLLAGFAMRRAGRRVR